MKRGKTGKLVIVLLAALCLAGCEDKQERAELVALVSSLYEERDLLQQDLESSEAARKAAEKELAALKAAPTPGPVVLEIPMTTPEVVEREVIKTVTAVTAVGVDCTLNGKERVALEGKTAVKAVAEPGEGLVFDHWTINGEKAEGGETASFTLSGDSVVRAVCVPEHTLTCINCSFQFANDKGAAKGDKYKDFNFEEDYVNPVTGKTVPGGKLTGVVTAEVPKGQEIDAWLINGVAYEPNSAVKSFLVTELDEQTVYEVRLIKASEKKYTVTCRGCDFSGGGYTHATSGKVKAGTKITVYGGLEGDWSGSGKNGYAPYQNTVHTQTYTVNKDCSFTWNGKIN